MNILHTLFFFAITLGILIVVHEFGHYIIAKLCGVKVLRFSVGFGKPLLIKRWGKDQTEWVIAAFPLGGYVKMLDEREGIVSSEERHRAFNHQSVYRRIAIVVAGPIANLLLAILIYWGLFMHGVPGMRPLLGDIPAASPAARAAFQSGDSIVKIADKEVATWQDVRWILMKHLAQKQPIAIEVTTPDNSVAKRTLDMSMLTAEDMSGDFVEKLGLMRFKPKFKAIVGDFMLPDGAGARAGLKAGDQIMAVNQQPVVDWDAFVGWISKSPGQPLQVEIKRGAQQLSVTLTPKLMQENGRSVGKIGVGPWIDPELSKRLLIDVRYSPLQALREATFKTWDTSVFSLQMLGRMVIGEMSWKNISGPVTIADVAGQSAQLGWLPFISFLALISISLGVLNLLPVPVLDGGHLMYYMVEIFKGSPVSEKAMEIGQQIGITALLMLMAFAFYNDINRLITG